MADKAEKAPKATEPTEEVEYETAAPKVKRGVDLTKFNTLSIVSIATAASGFGAVAGVITGHVALSQLKRTDERGRGLALTGVILGYGYLALGLGSMVLGSALRMRGIEFGQGQMHGNNLPGNMHGGFGFDQHNGFGAGMMGDNDGDRGFGPGQMGQFGPDQNGQMGQFDIVAPNQNGQLPVQPGMPIPTPATTN